uniref:odorant receptor 131-2-like n=1 Tax=Semicossyphus pulcher TaxID=241346 RepID=UPI0037E8791F
MSEEIQFQTNITVGLGLLERVMFSTLVAVTGCMLLFINGTMLFTLRSKPVFSETSRYVLLYNLLVADTLQMAMSQLLYVLSACRLMLPYPICGLLIMFARLTTDISPLTLVVMSLERYIAVCYPLRHAAIIPIRNTLVAIIGVWAFSSLNVLTHLLLLLQFPFEDLESLQMKEFCSKLQMYLVPMSYVYNQAYTCFLFITAGVAITSSYIGVVVAARSASTDKESAHKVCKTLLLHLFQLGLSLMSMMHTTLLIAISEIVRRSLFVYIMSVFYVFVYILPRCLSALIYGLRDQTIRPVFFSNLCCRLKLSP